MACRWHIIINVGRWNLAFAQYMLFSLSIAFYCREAAGAWLKFRCEDEKISIFRLCRGGYGIICRSSHLKPSYVSFIRRAAIFLQHDGQCSSKRAAPLLNWLTEPVIGEKGAKASHYRSSSLHYQLLYYLTRARPAIGRSGRLVAFMVAVVSSKLFGKSYLNRYSLLGFASFTYMYSASSLHYGQICSMAIFIMDWNAFVFGHRLRILSLAEPLYIWWRFGWESAPWGYFADYIASASLIF